MIDYHLGEDWNDPTTEEITKIYNEAYETESGYNPELQPEELGYEYLEVRFESGVRVKRCVITLFNVDFPCGKFEEFQLIKTPGMSWQIAY